MPTFYHEVLPSGGLRQIIEWTPIEVSAVLRTLAAQGMLNITDWSVYHVAGTTSVSQNGAQAMPPRTPESLLPGMTEHLGDHAGTPAPVPSLEPARGQHPASVEDARFYPCIGSAQVPSCTHMGSIHTPACAVCGCPEHHPWTPPEPGESLHVPVVGEGAKH